MSNELELYLIAHKVRGQPAFDIATREEVEGEEMWIIPTSGHRAYPYWFIALDSIEFEGDGNYNLSEELANMPPSLRDHYTTSASPRPSPTAGRDILSTLGLIKPAKPVKRRI